MAAPLDPAIDAVAAGSFATKQPPDIRGSGYVVASLEAALWTFAAGSTYGRDTRGRGARRPPGTRPATRAARLVRYKEGMPVPRSTRRS